MPDTPPPDRAKILDAVQSILEDDRSLGLTPRDIALLVLMRYEIESSSEIALSLSQDQRDRHFPNDSAIIRLVGAMMLEQNDEWSRFSADICSLNDYSP